MLEKLQTWLVVTVIAVLVWLYAEGEAVDQHQMQLQLRFVPPPGRQLIVEPQAPADPDAPVLVWATFLASTGQMDQVEAIANQGPIEIVVADRPDAETPEQVVVLEEALARSPLGELGVSIVETSPPTVNVWVEPLKTEQVEVLVHTGDLQLAQPPIPEPLKVPVVVPTRLAEAARNLKVVADLTAIDLSQLEVNEPHTLPAVPLRLPAALEERGVRLERDSVRVNLTIRKQTDSVTLTTVPIHINTPPLVLQRYNIALREDQMVLRDVRLTGPADVIDRIRRKDTRVWAELRPSADELDTGVESLPVYLNAPPAVTVESPLPQVPVTVTRRESPPS